MSQTTQQSSLDAFHEFSSGRAQRLKEVWERVTHGCRVRIVLKFTTYGLELNVDEDDDTIEVRCLGTASIDVSELRRADADPPWSRFLGKAFGWGWVATNQQGYEDGVLLSFDGLAPSILICVAASSANVLLLTQASGKPKPKSGLKEPNGHRTRTRRPNHR